MELCLTKGNVGLIPQGTYEVWEGWAMDDFEFYLLKHKKRDQLYALRRNKAVVLVRLSALSGECLRSFTANPGEAWHIVLERNWRHDRIPRQDAKVMFTEIVYWGLARQGWPPFVPYVEVINIPVVGLSGSDSWNGVALQTLWLQSPLCSTFGAALIRATRFGKTQGRSCGMVLFLVTIRRGSLALADQSVMVERRCVGFERSARSVLA